MGPSQWEGPFSIASTSNHISWQAAICIGSQKGAGHIPNQDLQVCTVIRAAIAVATTSIRFAEP